jgi:hypothetical protein
MKHVPIGIPPGTRALRIDRIAACAPRLGHWRIWIHANPQFTLGTTLNLYDDGSLERVVMRDGEGDDVMQMKGPDR